MTDKTDMSLRDAAQAVIDRWDTPLWKDAPATAVFIADLRDALARDAGRASMQFPGFSAEDMATAGAQGFRDGVASLSANAGEPTQGAFQRALSIRTAQGWKLGGDKLPVLYTDEINGEQVCRDDVWLCTTAALAAPPTAQAEGWVSVEERMPPPFEEMIVHPRPDDYCCEAFCDTAGNWKWAEYEHNFGVHHRPCTVTHWKPNLPPTSADGVEHG